MPLDSIHEVRSNVPTRPKGGTSQKIVLEAGPFGAVRNETLIQLLIIQNVMEVRLLILVIITVRIGTTMSNSR